MKFKQLCGNTYINFDNYLKVTFRNWDIGQPDHIKDNGCVSMYINSFSNNNGKWNDVHCFQRYGLGCQSDAGNAILVSSQ